MRLRLHELMAERRRYMLAGMLAATFLAALAGEACPEESLSTAHAAAWLLAPSAVHFAAQEQALRRRDMAEANLLGSIDPPGRASVAIVGWLAGSAAVHEISKGHKTRGRVALGVLIALQLAGAAWDMKEARR